jgi:hypothetical protein
MQMQTFWVLQVVGSNPAAPTKNTVESLGSMPGIGALSIVIAVPLAVSAR